MFQRCSEEGDIFRSFKALFFHGVHEFVFVNDSIAVGVKQFVRSFDGLFIDCRKARPHDMRSGTCLGCVYAIRRSVEMYYFLFNRMLTAKLRCRITLCIELVRR